MRLLIIDDNADDRVLIRHLLPSTHEAREATTLADAFTLLADPGWQPEVILLDLHLPDGDGPHGETWSAVRSLNHHAPVIVVSAQSLTDDPHLGRQAKAAGAAGFTSKELIVFSPENLARQLDWAACPAARSLAMAVTNPAAAPELAAYDPNSLPALIARLISQQDAMHAENQTVAIQRKEQLDRIETQIRATSAEVGALKTWRENQASILKTAAKVISITTAAVLFLFGPQLKERLFIDREAVRKIANEQIDVKAAIASVQPTGQP